MVVIEVKQGVMTAFSKVIPFTCHVRNELNHLRGMAEVVYSENEDGSKGVPYMPRPFPVGRWALGMPAPTNDPLMMPYFIPTTGWQMVEEWRVEDRNGKLWYVEKTGNQVKDWGYGLHASTAKESNGCLHIVDSDRPGYIDAGMPSGLTTKYDYIDFMVKELIDWLRNPQYEQPPEILYAWTNHLTAMKRRIRMEGDKAPLPKRIGQRKLLRATAKVVRVGLARSPNERSS